MLCQRELFYLSERLNQIKCELHPFGGVAVLLVGETVQIPLVQGDPLWFNNSRNQDDVNGHHIFLLFDNVVELKENTI